MFWGSTKLYTLQHVILTNITLLFAGIKSSGKVVYFSATFPYLLLITLMIYALLQDGAIDGVKRLFIDIKWEGEGSVLDFNVWREAAGQVKNLL